MEGTLRLVPNLDASAKNMQAVCKAKEQHDKTCPWGGTGTEVHMNWFDIERIGWEEGDVICGLVVVGDETVATGMMRTRFLSRVSCSKRTLPVILAKMV